MPMTVPYRLLVNKELTTLLTDTSFVNPGGTKVTHVKSVMLTNTTDSPILVTGYSYGTTGSCERFTNIVLPKPKTPVTESASASNVLVVEDFAVLTDAQAIYFKASALGVNCVVTGIEEDFSLY